MLKEFTPLRACIRYWPSFLGDANFLDDAGLTEYDTEINDQRFYISGKLAIFETLEFPFLGLPDLTISILKQGNYTEIPFEANISPVFQLAIPSIEIKLELDNKFIIPVVQQNNDWVKKTDAGGNLLPFSVGLSGYGISYELDDNIQLVANSPSITIDTAQIGDTGIIVSFSNVTPFLSEKDVENSTLELPGDFKGVSVGEAAIMLPPKWFSDPDAGDIPPGESSLPTGIAIKGYNLLIGTGGFSGTVALEGNDLLYKKIGNFWIGLDSFGLTFKQNAITDSTITGKLIIPKFKKTDGGILTIDVKAMISEDGSFNLTASTDSPIPVFDLENVFSMEVDSLFIGKQSDDAGGKAYIGVSGLLDFKSQGDIGKFLPDKVDISKMLIYDDGSFEFDGGGLVLPKAFDLTVGPVKIGVTAIHFGSYEQDGRQYKFFGFDGGVSVNPGGVDARGKGVKLFFTVDDGQFDWFIKLESLAIDIILPSGSDPDNAAVIIKGFLSIRDPQIPSSASEDLKKILKNSTEYAGSVYVSIPKFKGLEASAAMRLNPDVPSFIVDLGLEISTPILLGTTGLGIYGFRGLFGKKYVATKTAADVPEDGRWWQYYKAKVAPDYKEGIQLSKFSIKNGFSIGAGASLATTFDSGKVLSTKLFFMLSLPDVFLFQGQAAILKERISLDAVPDPPFFALISITKESIEAGFGVNYKLPEEGNNAGKILTIDGVIEMGFFFGNSSAWYLNIGRDTPENMRIQARVLSMFNMYSYLMLSNAGMKAGAGMSITMGDTFGPLKAELQAYFDAMGRISFRPKQIGAGIQIGGSYELSVCGLGFAVNASAALAAESPKPHTIAGDIKGCVKVLGKEYCAKFDFTKVKDNTLDKTQVPVLADMDSNNNIVMEDAKKAACATNIATGETFPVAVLPLNATDSIPAPGTNWIGNMDQEDYTIPMDSYIDIEFKKPVLSDSGNTAGNIDQLGGAFSPSEYDELIPPQKGKSTRIRHEYRLEKIEINYYDEVDSQWKPYHFYNAMLPLYPTNGDITPLIDQSVLEKTKWGYWQQQRKGFNNKLRILATTPLSYASKTGRNIIPENLGVDANTIFCRGTARSLKCTEFGNEVLHSKFKYNKLHHYKDILFKHSEHDGVVIEKPHHSIDNGLYIEPGDILELPLKERMKTVNLIIGTGAENVVAKYYRRIYINQTNQHAKPFYNYELLETKNLTASELANPVEYTATNGDIHFITIEAGSIIEEPLKKCIPLNQRTETLNLLREYINELAVHGHLTPQEDYVVLNSRENYEYYANTFINTDLYPNTLSEEEELRLTMKYLSGKNLVLMITDEQGYYCKFSFELHEDSDEISYSNVSAVTEIMALADCPDSAYSNAFRLTVKDNEENTYILLARSCNILSDCFCYTENSTYLYQICYLTYGDYLKNQSIIPASLQDSNNSALLDSINKTLQPIWRPNTAYAIRIRTSDSLEGEDDSSISRTYQNDLVFGFKTAGPVGHFHKYPVSLTEESKRTRYSELESKSKEEEFKLKSLKHYIDYAKSYPNADGDLINAKPLYYIDAELNLFYLYNYVYEFYNDWSDYEHPDAGSPVIAHAGLDIKIQDPLKSESVDEPDTMRFKGNNISHDNGSVNDPTLPPANINSINNDIRILNNMLANNSTPCVSNYNQLAPIDIASEKSVTLKPSKLYTAQVISNYNPRINQSYKSEAWKTVVHSYVFRTSRYADFGEHIDSFVLNKDNNGNITKSAVFMIEAGTPGATLDFSRAERVLSDSLNANDVQLEQHYANKFDRLINGVLHISLPIPVTTEFNIVKNPATNSILGIIVQSPEPFNDPKMPKADPVISSTEEFETLEVKQPDSMDDPSEFFVIHSKDRAKMFVTNRDFSFSVPADAILEFKFRYKLYTGTTYADKTVKTVEIDLSNFSF